MLKELRIRLKRYLKRSRLPLPSAMRDRVYRRMVRLDLNPPAGLMIKVARTKAEHIAAFRLLHDAYVEAGYMKPDPSGMRMNSYQATPGHRVLIAVQNGVVLATCSLIPDSSLGLPMDAVFNLGPSRKRLGRIAEISALAIKSGYRGHPGRLMFPMVQFLFQYALGPLKLGGLVFCMQPRHFEFYRAFFYARPLRHGYVAEYGFVGGAPAQAGVLNLAASVKWGKKSYAGSAADRNVYEYLIHRTLPHVEPVHEVDPTAAMLAAEDLAEHFAACAIAPALEPAPQTKVQAAPPSRRTTPCPRPSFAGEAALLLGH